MDSLAASHDPALRARGFGVDTLMGKSLLTGRRFMPSRRTHHARFGARRMRGALGDVPISTDVSLTENRPSIAAHPWSKRHLVVAHVASIFPEEPLNRCAVRRSRDRGRTWSEPVYLPIRSSALACADPVLAYSRDGQRLYAAYGDIRDERSETSDLPGGGFWYRREGDSDIVVSVSRNHGRTWSKPVPALDGDTWGVTVTCFPDDQGNLACETSDVVAGSNYGRASLSAPSCFRKLVFVTGTRIAQLDAEGPPSAIDFARSVDGGRRWSPATAIDFTVEEVSRGIVQGSKVVSGPWGRPLVAWYHPSDDGFRVGRFEIRTRYSPDHGRTWAPIVTAVIDEDEANFWLGPLGYYKQWWTTMFPDVALDRGGRAHITYTHDPEPGDLTPEEGDIRYLTSPGAPFDEWTAPVTVNDDGPGRAQGFPSLLVRDRGRRSIVDIFWEDTRLTPDLPTAFPSSPNLYYDVFHAWRVPGHGAAWSPNRRVSDESSIQDELVAGGRTGLAGSDDLVFGVWADRRHAESVTDRNSDIYGSRVLSGRGWHQMQGHPSRHH